MTNINMSEDKLKKLAEQWMSKNPNNMFSIDPNVLSAGASVGGGLIGGTISGGLQSGAGNIMNGIADAAAPIASAFGPIGAGAVGALKVVGGLTNKMFGSKLNKENINTIENSNKAMSQLQIDDSSNDAIMDQWGNTSLGLTFNRKDVGTDGWFSNKAKNKFLNLRGEQTAARNRAVGSLNNAIYNADNTMDQNVLSNFAAYGGPLNMKTLAPMSPFGNRFDIGGGINELMNNPAGITNGITAINNGGTHEQNPNEGVQMGVDQQGVPNLVEEGEVVYDDYVFSDRIKVPKSVIKDMKLQNKKGLTFADAAKYLQKESEERPNDPISKKGLNASLGRLSSIQEEIKAVKQQEEQQKRVQDIIAMQQMMQNQNQLAQPSEYAYGGKLANKFDLGGNEDKPVNTFWWPDADLERGESICYKNHDGNHSIINLFGDELQSFLEKNKNKILRRNSFYSPDEGFIYLDYKHYLDTLNPENRNKSVENFVRNNFNTRDYKEMYDYFLKDAKKTYNRANFYALTKEPKYLSSFPNDLNLAVPPEISTEELNNLNKKIKSSIRYNNNNNNNNPTWSSKKGEWLRYMPIAGTGMAALSDIFGLTNKPDFTNADKIEASVANIPEINYTPIGNYMEYKPSDIDYLNNKLAAQSGATRRAIENMSGNNRGLAMANLLASDYNSQIAQGDALMKMDELNYNKKKEAEIFNRDTDKFNSEMGLKAMMANQANNELKLRAIMASSELRDKERQLAGAAKSANLTNLFDNLGNLGIDIANRNDIYKLIASGVIPRLSSVWGYDDLYNALQTAKEADNKNNKNSNDKKRNQEG